MFNCERKPTRAGWSAGWCTMMIVAVSVCLAAAPPGQASAPSTPAAPASRVFSSDAGVVLNFIKPDKAADFEVIVQKLREALGKSEKPGRKQQALGWKVYRAVEPGGGGSVLYVFVMDPAVKGQDYAVSTILAEAFPSEVQDLYKRFAEAYASGQNIVNLSVVSQLGQ